MVNELMLLGMPLFLVSGIIVLISLFTTASIPLLNKTRKKKIPMRYHFIMARVTIVLAVIHVTLGILSYL